MENIIEFQNINMSYQTKYQKVELFNNLNLEIEAGEFVVILGPSGSGKSTLLNLMAGFIRPSSGNIIVDGEQISNLNEKDICKYRNKKLGFIFQFYNLINTFTAIDNVVVPLLLSGISMNESKNIASKLLAEIKLGDRLNHYPVEMSGGEQQRVAIARAIANNPKIILADEPTGNLDQKTGQIILDLLSDINQTGTTIVVVTHDITIAKRASKIIDMNEIIDT